MARAGLVIAVAGLTAASCSGGENGGSTTVAPTTEVVTTTAAPTTTKASTVTTAPVYPNMKPEEVAVRNVLDDFAYESTAAYESPDPNRASLLALITGQFKARMVANLTKYQADGELSRRLQGGVSPHETRTVEWPNPNTAVANECWIDDMAVYKQGEQPGAVEGARIAYRTTVIREADQQWRISSQEERNNADSAAFCRGF
jgi:hypothetical protein